MGIEGVSDILLTFRFRCPPGKTPEQVAAHIAQGGVCVACGLLQFLKSTDCSVVPLLDEGPKLHSI